MLPTSRMVSEVMFPISESRLGKVVTFSVVLLTSTMVSEVMFPISESRPGKVVTFSVV